MSDAERRELLKRGILVLGAGLLIQPNGGVGAEAQDAPKKEERDEKAAGKERKGANEKKGGAQKKHAPPPKEG